MARVISRHNKQVIKESKKEQPVTKPDKPCVMGGKCVEESVLYEGAVTRLDAGQTEFHTGLSELSWKLRWNNHRANFRTDSKANRTATCLSKHSGKIKDKKIQYYLEFKQLAKASSFH